MTPSTVPSSPMSGLTEPIVASHGRKRPMRSRSSDASASSSRCSVSICDPLSVAAVGRIAAARRRHALANLLVGDARVGDEAHRAHEEARQRARLRLLGERGRFLEPRGVLELLPELVGRSRRLLQRAPDAEHDRPTEQRKEHEHDQDDLRDGRRVEDEVDRARRNSPVRGLQTEGDARRARSQCGSAVLARRTSGTCRRALLPARPVAHHPRSDLALSTARNECGCSPGRFGANSIGVVDPAALRSTSASSRTDVGTPVPTLNARSSRRFGSGNDLRRRGDTLRRRRRSRGRSRASARRRRTQ